MINYNSDGFRLSLSAGIKNIITYGILQALLAFSIYYVSCVVLNLDWWPAYGIIVGIGTIQVYMVHKILKTHRSIRLKLDSDWIYLLSLGLIVVFVAIRFPIPEDHLFHLVLPAFLTSFYLMPARYIGILQFQKGWLKSATLAFTWTWLCIGPINTFDFEFWCYTGSCGCLLLCNAILFDIKDIKQDQQSMRSTVAMHYGWKKAKMLAFIALIMSIVCALLLFKNNALSCLLLLFCLLTYSLICRKINPQIRTDFYYKYLDGGLFLFPAGMLLANYFQSPI